MNILSVIRTAIETHALIEKGQRVLVGVSGGADSVALLYALHFLSARLEFELVVAHLHHGTRGAASDADMRFVQSLCWRLGVPCFTREVDVPEYARQSGRSLEMEAREVRHSFFADTLKVQCADAVVLAHTADDQAETFLLKLARGAGLRGLAGMSAVQRIRGMRVVRPMLDVPRAEIEAFLNRHGLAWREDASNADPQFRRNRIRHEVLPFLEETLNPNIRQTLLRTMDVLREEDEWISELAASCLVSVSSSAGEVICGGRLAAYPAAARRRVIMTWLFQRGVPPAAVDFDCVRRVDELLLSKTGSRSVQITDRLRVLNQYGELRVSAVDAPEVEVRLELIVKSAHGFIVDSASRIGAYPSCAAIDEAKVAGRKLTVRLIRAGDRMCPLGMSGSRKLQDILVDEKVPRELRRTLPVVVCEGEIVWLPGYRISENWKVHARHAAALHLTLVPAKGEVGVSE